VSGSEGRDEKSEDHERVEVLEVSSGQRWMAPLRGSQSYGQRIAFSPTGKTLVIAGYGELTFVDVAARRVAAVDRHSGMGAVVDVAFKPNSQQFVAAGDVVGQLQPLAALFDADLRHQLHRISDDWNRKTTAITFSPDGKSLVSGSEDGTVFIEDATTLKPLAVPISANPKVTDDRDSRRIARLRFNRDGRLLAIAGANSVVLWDMLNGQMIGAPIASPSFSIDGQAMTEGVVDLAFTADGKSLLTAHPFSQSIIRWDMDPASWLNRVCVAANRNLTRVEWTQYIGTTPYRKTCPISD